MTQDPAREDPFSVRRAGVLLHPTCLNSSWGVLGHAAREFVDFLNGAGIRVWQTLPIGPTHGDKSPYQSLSAHAGNPDFIDLAELGPSGLLQPKDLDESACREGRASLLATAAERFFARAPNTGDGLNLADYQAFCRTNDYWLRDFSLFCAIRESLSGLEWASWPAPLRDREPEALEAFSRQASETIRRVCFEQYLFHYQWQLMRRYARERDVLLFGDIPIFVSHDSADVWANRNLFKLDARGRSTVVAGVPPDYFSADGQHWGNPIYNWETMAADDYLWWRQRLESQRHLFDLIRIDHFRGLHAYWEIPADQPTASNGYWVPGPADKFLASCYRAFPDLPLVAENLGIISDEVEQLRRAFRMPGMTVLQFGFDGSPANPHLLHNHRHRDLVYTGTHDNDTTLGWYLSLDDHTRDYVNRYLGCDGQDMPWPMIRAVFSSVSSLAVVPMQDFLGLDSSARFNTPGTTENNWEWQLDQRLLQPELAERIRELAGLYGRLM